VRYVRAQIALEIYASEKELPEASHKLISFSFRIKKKSQRSLSKDKDMRAMKEKVWNRRWNSKTGNGQIAVGGGACGEREKEGKIEKVPWKLHFAHQFQLMTKKIRIMEDSTFAAGSNSGIHPFPKTFVFIQPLKFKNWLVSLKMKVPFFYFRTRISDFFFGWYVSFGWNLFNGGNT
jgi:hypothetical protein